ncbi:hypothetical protein Tcan_08925, partial [Toxocara canis]
KLSKEELEVVDAVYTMLNPSLEGVCDAESWLKKTDVCASVAACILDASKETVVMQHSGDELKALLDKISGVEFTHLCKLLDEGNQKTTNSSRTQQKLNGRNVIRGEYDRNNKRNGEHLSVRFDSDGAYRRRDRRHTWNENRFGGSCGYNNMHYRSLGMNRHSSYSNYNRNGYVGDRIYNDDSYYGYYPTLSPYSLAGPIVSEPCYCFAYPSNLVDTQHFTDFYTAENSVPNQEDHVFVQDSLCTCPPYTSENSQPPLARMVNPVEMVNVDATHSSEPIAY